MFGDYTKMCRVCTSNGSRDIFHRPICGDSAADVAPLDRLLEKLRYVTMLKIEESDNLPYYLCDLCIVQLNVAYNFKKQAIENDTKLRQYYIESGRAHNRENFSEATSGARNPVPTTEISNTQYRFSFIPSIVKTEPIDCESYDTARSSNCPTSIFSKKKSACNQSDRDSVMVHINGSNSIASNDAETLQSYLGMNNSEGNITNDKRRKPKGHIQDTNAHMNNIKTNVTAPKKFKREVKNLQIDMQVPVGIPSEQTPEKPLNIQKGNKLLRYIQRNPAQVKPKRKSKLNGIKIGLKMRQHLINSKALQEEGISTVVNVLNKQNLIKKKAPQEKEISTDGKVLKKPRLIKIKSSQEKEISDGSNVLKKPHSNKIKSSQEKEISTNANVINKQHLIKKKSSQEKEISTDANVIDKQHLIKKKSSQEKDISTDANVLNKQHLTKKKSSQEKDISTDANVLNKQHLTKKKSLEEKEISTGTKNVLKKPRLIKIKSSQEKEISTDANVLNKQHLIKKKSSQEKEISTDANVINKQHSVKKKSLQEKEISTGAIVLNKLVEKNRSLKQADKSVGRKSLKSEYKELKENIHQLK